MAVGGLLGCGGPNSLSGSVDELFSLEVSRVEVLRNAEALQVSYYRNNGLDVDLVARLSVATEGLELKPGAKVNLAGQHGLGVARATVVHLAAGEPARVFAPVDKGDLQIDEGGARGPAHARQLLALVPARGGVRRGAQPGGPLLLAALDAGFGPEPIPLP